jgi:hypothetical protein
MKHISEIIDEILVEWAYRVHDGMPNPKNSMHIVQLRESMEELNIPNDVIYKVINNMINEEDIVKNKDSGNVYPVKNHNPNTQDLVKKDASPEDIKKVKKDGDGEEKTKDDKQKSMVGSSEQQQQKTKIDKGVKQNLDFIVENAGNVRTQGGAGSDTPTRQQVKDLQTFTEKRMEQDARRKAAEEKGEEFNEEPYVHPNIVQREIDDKTLDEALDYLKKQLGPEAFDNLIRFLSKGGAVHSHLTRITKLKRGEAGLDPESPGYKRVRELIRLYLKNDGKCAVTGVPMKLSECDPDHRIPYSSAVKEAERNGTTVEEEQRKLDDFTSNLDLMFGPINKFKSSLVDDKLLNATRKRLAMSKEAEEVKKLKTLYKNQRAEALEEHYRKKFSLGDFSSLTEKNIAEADDSERNAMMKAWNYMHPSKKEMREQIEGKKSAGLKGDPDYYKKLKKAWKAQGVELPDNPDDIDWNKPPFSKWMNRYGFGDSGEKRQRSTRLSPGPEREYMKEHFTKSGQKVPTIKEQEEADEVIDEARQKIRKETTLKQIEIEKIKLRDPNLSDKQKQNVQKKIDKLKKSLE